tara:strand:- start:239 stop:370 length:132 start_codon:yes stop_codon:yes gene_type:complete
MKDIHETQIYPIPERNIVHSGEGSFPAVHLLRGQILLKQKDGD